MRRFVSRDEVRPRFEGKAVAIVGSGPGVMQNQNGFIDSHDVVVRVNNFKLLGPTGNRTDVHYSYYGTAIRKTKYELKRGGVTLCMCKCPNAHAIESDWHKRMNQMIGVDYRPHYEKRKEFWFCDTYIPEVADFLAHFHLLGGHIPTTGFSAILDVLSLNPKAVYLTGFDFFSSRIHNVNERWKPGRNPDDPIRHVPEAELAWLRENFTKYPITVDAALAEIMGLKAAA